jgi:hypothetical protein
MKRKNIIAHVAAIIVGIILGLWVSHCTCKPVETIRVERDTIVTHDTIVDNSPKAKDSVTINWVTRYLSQFVGNTDTLMMWTHDTVAVEVPITSKHYNAPEYDAWVSGYEPSLDSIKVYREAQYITERVTISKPPNKWELDAVAGLDYNVATQRYTPHIGGELLYKPNRLQVGIRGGVIKNDNFEPYVGAVIKLRVF